MANTRRPDIQGLRAIAVVMVVAFHAGLPFPGGFVGVDVFFVISGYVITAMLQREWVLTSRIQFARFYIRRFKRLTPALALTVLVTMALSVVILSPFGPQQTAAQTAIGALLLVANAAIAAASGDYFDAPAATNPLLNMWSLSVEEQFYLAFPLILVIGWRLGRRSVVSLVAGISVLSLIGALLGGRGIGGDWLGFYSPLTRAWEFGVGALIALMAVKFDERRAQPAAVVGALMLVASLFLITETTPFPGLWTLLPVIGTALLIMSGTTDHVVSRALSSLPMVRIGDWSYSIYLWHWPAIVLAGIAFPAIPAIVPALLSLIPALLSFRYLEEPIRNREFTAPQLVRTIAITIGTPAVVAAGVWVFGNLVLRPSLDQQLAPARALHAGYENGCHFGPSSGNTDPEPCVWNVGGTGAPVYLLGDSNAAQFAEALIGATETRDRPLYVTTSSGCPYLDLTLQQSQYPGYDERCRLRNERLQEWITSMTAGTVVLSSSSEYWLGSRTAVRRDGVWETDVDAKVSLFEQSLTRIVDRLTAAGHTVLFVQGIPHFVEDYAWNLDECSVQALRSGCDVAMPLAWSRERTKPVADAVSRIAEAGNVELADVAELLCPDGTCRTVNDGFAIYRDGTHITVAMSERLAPDFARLL